MNSPQKKLSILQVCHDTKGPFVNVCRQYARAFDGHNVTTVFLKGSPDKSVEDRIGGSKVVFLAGNTNQANNVLSGLKMNTLIRMYRLLRENSFDMAIAHRYKAIYVVCIMSLIFSLPKILAVAHEFNMFRRLTRRIFIRLIVRFGSAEFLMAGVSTSVTNSIGRQCPVLKESASLLTLYNTIDVGQAKNILSRSEARAKLSLSEQEIVIGSIGRLVKKKNQDVLVEAFSNLQQDNTKLILIGSGPEESNLRDLVDQKRLGESVVLAGPKDEAYRYVRAFDLFVLPSGVEEAFGVVLLEAMMGGVPILSSDAPGPKEVLGDAGDFFVSGNITDLSKKIEQILNRSSDVAKALTDANLSRLNKVFAFDAFERKLHKILSLETY